MKKILLISIISGLMLLNGINADPTLYDTENELISSQVSFSIPEIKDLGEYSSIHFDEAKTSLNTVSNPMVPLVTKQYILPFGSSIESINVNMYDSSRIELSKDIIPASQPLYISTEFQQDSNELIKNQEVYGRNDAFPEKSWSYKIGAGLYGKEHVTYLSIHICPMLYYPLSKEVEVFSHADIDIEYIVPDTSINAIDEFDMLILTPSEFANALQPLIDAKNNVGIKTTLATLNDIPNVGVDTQEDIKYFIKDAIETMGITYVLLVGGGLEDDEKFPVRYAWVASGNYERNFPSDLYYADIYNADMQLSNWDNDSDGKYAEYPADNDAVDLYPDVYLGRLPCNTVSEVEIVVEKIITYMNTNKMTNTIVQIGGDTFTNDPERVNEGEFANNEVMKNLHGYTTTQLWGSKGNLKRWRILLEIYKGVDFVDFSGHGSVVSFATHPPEDDTRWIPEGIGYDGFTYFEPTYYLYNSWKLPVIFLNACSCSKFSEYDNCLSWSFVRKDNGGGIASFGASGIGYGSYGTSETERLFGWMEYHVFKELYDMKILGDVWGTCLTEYINSFEMEDADYKTVYELELFGDPTLPIDDA